MLIIVFCNIVTISAAFEWLPMVFLRSCSQWEDPQHWNFSTHRLWKDYVNRAHSFLHGQDCSNARSRSECDGIVLNPPPDLVVLMIFQNIKLAWVYMQEYKRWLLTVLKDEDFFIIYLYPSFPPLAHLWNKFLLINPRQNAFSPFACIGIRFIYSAT